jgi:hypothetical protein
MTTPRTTLAPGAPSPSPDDWMDYVATATKRREDRAAREAAVKRKAKRPRKYQKAKA